MTYKILNFTFLFLICGIMHAQNLLPSPPAGLEGDRGQIARTLLDSKDEALLCKMIEQPGDDEHVRYLKMLACKRLSIYGTDKSIPVLVKMLSHPEMAMYARFALEPMPSKAVDAALREAVATHSGMPLVGILTTIGVRRDAEAVPSVLPLLKSEDKDVQKAAFAALGYIGSEACVAPLIEGLNGTTLESEKAICDAVFNCAEHRVKAKKKEEAVDLYDAVLAANVRPFLKEAAVFAKINEKGKNGIEDIVKYLHEKDKGLFEAALQTIREYNPTISTYKLEIADIVLRELDKLSPERQGLVIEAVAGRKDDASKKAAYAVAVAVKEPEILKVSAMNALGAIDGAGVVPTLLLAAEENGGSSDTAKAAFRALIFLVGDGVDAAIAKHLTEEAKISAVGIRLAKERRIVGVTSALEKTIADKNNPNRSIAIDAIGETATLAELPFIAGLLKDAQSDDEKKQIAISLSAVCARMPQDTSIEKVLTLTKSDVKDIKVAGVELLKTIGGKKAVDAVTAMAFGNDPDLMDKATQTLGVWDSPDTMNEIAASLLRVAQEAKENRDRVRGIRGYVRLARQFNFPEDQRIAMIHKSFEVARRAEDKALIFDVFGRYPTPKMLQAAMKYVSDPTYKEQACVSAVAVGEKLQGRSTATADAMSRVIETTQNADTKAKASAVKDKQAGATDASPADTIKRLKKEEGELKIVIVSATYGQGVVYANVAEMLKEKLNGTRFIDVDAYNSVFGDPSPNVVKSLKISYTIDGGPEKSVSFAENAPILLPK